VSGIVDRERYGTLAKIIAETLLGTDGATKDPDAIALVTEQIVRTIEADPALGQSGAVIRIAQSLEGIAGSLHVLQGLYGLDCAARGVVEVQTLEKLVGQAIEAYNLNRKAESRAKGEKSDLPPGVLG